MKILNLLPAVVELNKIATKNINTYDMIDYETEELILNNIDNYDIIITSENIKNKYFSSNKKVISGRKYLKNKQYNLNYIEYM